MNGSRQAAKSGTPTQAPFWQLSVVQASPSTHGAPFGWKISGGQALFTPSQSSATSHCPAAGRQTTLFAATASGGQAALLPSQTSCTSHAPAAGRQTAPPFPAGCWQSA